jgi:DNA repair protein RecO (recombination protein O)
MSEIIKDEAVVLSKLNYGDTSCIINFYTKERGKLSAIIKGGRNPKSKMGMTADPLNHLLIVVYKKESRELQLISQADLISHFPNIKSDFKKISYAYAVIELIKSLTMENEANKKLFSGVVRILNLMDQQGEDSSLLFARFFLFFLKEIGYELPINKCSICGRTNLSGMELSYNSDFGILCNNCSKDYSSYIRINSELFDLLKCLKHNFKLEYPNPKLVESSIILMEKHLKYHINDFKGIQSLKMF